MHEPIVLSQNLPIAIALAPDADRYNGNPETDVFSLKDARGICFYLQEGAGGTGTVKIVAQACDDTTPSNTTNINFVYSVATLSGGYVFGAATRTTVAADGYTTTAGADKLVEIFIDARDLPDGMPYVRLDLTEVANDPCDAAILAVLTRPRNVEPGSMQTVLT